MSNIYELIKAGNDATKAWQDACDVARAKWLELAEAERCYQKPKAKAERRRTGKPLRRCPVF